MPPTDCQSDISATHCPHIAPKNRSEKKIYFPYRMEPEKQKIPITRKEDTVFTIYQESDLSAIVFALVDTFIDISLKLAQKTAKRQ